MAISFVAEASWSSSTSDTSFTITKPTGTASGDFMIAIVAVDTFSGGGGDVTITPPTGWTQQAHTFTGSGQNLAISVLKRTAGASEPASWTGTLSGARAPKMSSCTTYRGASGIAVDGTSTALSVSTFNTATVNNTSSLNWRLVKAAYTSASVSFAITSSEVIKRGGAALTTVEGGSWDSNAAIASGNTSRTVSRSQVWESAASWIGILTPSATSTNANAGTVAVTAAANAPTVVLSLSPTAGQASATAAAFDAKVKVSSNAGTVAAASDANQAVGGAGAKAGVSAATAGAFNAVRGILPLNADGTATAYDPSVSITFKAGFAAASADAFSKTFRTGTTDASAVAYNTTTRNTFSTEHVTVFSTAYGAVVSFSRLAEPQTPSEATATANDASVRISFTAESVVVTPDSNQQIGGLGPSAGVANATTASNGALAGLGPSPGWADLTAGAFDPLTTADPAFVTASAYDATILSDPPPWRTRKIDAESRAKAVASESRTLVVARRITETVVR